MLLNSFFFTSNAKLQNGDVIVNLSGASTYEADTVYPAGKYEIEVQSGGNSEWNTDTQQYISTIDKPGKISQIIQVNQSFIIRGYCGSKGTKDSGGINLYSGPYKVSPYQGDISNVTHIFGNCGSCSRGVNNTKEGYGSGNSLGNGVVYSLYNLIISCGAGSCLHILPKNGIFGTDYLFAFHTTAAPVTIPFLQCGGGSAYGGSASGGASSTGSQGSQSQNGFIGGNTPYGTGGTRAYSGTGLLAYGYGSDGTGIGHGYVGDFGDHGSIIGKGATAWYNGTEWLQSDSWANPGEEGKIKVTYLGPS